MKRDLPGTLLLDRDVINDPYPFYAQLRDHAPVWRVPGTEVFVVSTFARLNEAAARVEDFSSNMCCLLYRADGGLPARLSFGASGANALATADPPIHKLHRDAVFPELVAKRMAALEPEIAEISSRCVERALAARDVDFMTDVGNVVPITVISRLIGFRAADLDQLLRAAFDSTALLGAMLTLAQLEALVGRSGAIGAWLAEQLTAATTEPRDDILGAIVRGIESQALGPGEGIIVLHTLLSAGGESTTSLLGNAVRLLAERQDLQQDLRRQPEQIPAFIEEMLRLESPFRLHLRSVPGVTVLGDVEIPAGSTVLLLWGAANRDPSVFERPDDVVLNRPVPRRHMAFGRGIHHCVGAPLARLEARVVLSVLLERTSSFTLGPAERPQWVESLMVRRHDRLPIRLVAA
jgi:cytochrome P450